MSASSSPAPETVDLDAFRDSIPTVNQKGRRVWIYPRRPKGPLYARRTLVSAFLLLILFLGPFIRINGNPLLMMNFVERRFSVFGMLFFPEDGYLFAIMMITVFISIVLFTAVFGRVWCGWLCPQTVLMEMVFRKIEYWIEGDGPKQKLLNKGPWNGAKIRKKLLKWTVFYALSFIIGNLLLAYIIGSDRLIEIVTDPPSRHVGGLTAMVLFSLMFFFIFTRFREQACTFICPYGRFQSVLLDENSLVVAYDNVRGEPRGKYAKQQTREQRQGAGVGDCINCGLCVAVCPTGIDIRHGTQMECVNCTACIDACSGVMQKVGFPTGLVRYASLNNIEKKEAFRFTPRLVAYVGLFTVLMGVLVFLLATKEPVSVDFLRKPGEVFQPLPGGQIGNVFLVKVLNRTSKDQSVDLKLEQPPGELIIAGNQLVAPARDLVKSAVIVKLDADRLQGAMTPIRVSAWREGRRIDRIESTFIGPGN